MKEPLTLEEKKKVETLSAQGLTCHAIGKRLSRSHHTIAKHLALPGVEAEIQRIKEDLATAFEELTARLLVSVDDTTIDRMSGYQKIVGASITLDKARLVRGKSTDNISIIAELRNVRDAFKSAEAITKLLEAKVRSGEVDE